MSAWVGWRCMVYSDAIHRMLSLNTQEAQGWGIEDGEAKAKADSSGCKGGRFAARFHPSHVLPACTTMYYYDRHPFETFTSNSDRRYLDVTRPDIQVLLRRNKQLISTPYKGVVRRRADLVLWDGLKPVALHRWTVNEALISELPSSVWQCSLLPESRLIIYIRGDTESSHRDSKCKAEIRSEDAGSHQAWGSCLHYPPALRSAFLDGSYLTTPLAEQTRSVRDLLSEFTIHPFIVFEFL